MWETYREDGKVKHRTIANLSNCSEEEIEAMRKRKVRDYLMGLEKLQKNYRDRDRFMKRLGVLQHEAGSSKHCVELTLPPEGVKVSVENFQYRFNARSYKEMIYRDGTYFLRTNQTGKGAVQLWQQYILQTHVEQAFKELKSDLSIRPIRHHLEERVEAHVFIAFMSYCLQMTLRQKLRHSAPGLTSRAALESLSKIKMLDVYHPHSRSSNDSFTAVYPTRNGTQNLTG